MDRKRIVSQLHDQLESGMTRPQPTSRKTGDHDTSGQEKQQDENHYNVELVMKGRSSLLMFGVFIAM